ncbi:hypothetical protein INR49_014504 [Caranx melampygus]|nr:hypothetical protein INR49_014504 [Caranx melampygus]
MALRVDTWRSIHSEERFIQRVRAGDTGWDGGGGGASGVAEGRPLHHSTHHLSKPSPLGKEGSPRSPAPTLWRSIAHCHLGKAGVSLGHATPVECCIFSKFKICKANKWSSPLPHLESPYPQESLEQPLSSAWAVLWQDYAAQTNKAKQDSSLMFPFWDTESVNHSTYLSPHSGHRVSVAEAAVGVAPV